MMPATEPLQVGVVVVVSVLNVVTVCTLGNASRAVVHDGFALSARSGFNNSPALRPVAGQALASVRGCPRHARHLLILGTYTLFLLPEVAGAGALSNTPPRICGTAPLHACLGAGGVWVLGMLRPRICPHTITRHGVVAWLGRACRRCIPCHPPWLGVRVWSSRGCGDGLCRGCVRLGMGA